MDHLNPIFQKKHLVLTDFHRGQKKDKFKKNEFVRDGG